MKSLEILIYIEGIVEKPDKRSAKFQQNCLRSTDANNPRVVFAYK